MKTTKFKMVTSVAAVMAGAGLTGVISARIIKQALKNKKQVEDEAEVEETETEEEVEDEQHQEDDEQEEIEPIDDNDIEI